MRRAAEWCVASKVRMSAAAALVGAVIATLLYLMNWYSYYDSMRVIKESQQSAYVAQVVEVLKHSRSNQLPSSDERKLLEGVIGRMRGRVSVFEGHPESPNWRISRDRWIVDESRTIVETKTTLGQFDPSLADVSVWIVEDNRPSFPTALMRGVSLSAADLIREPDAWFEKRLVFRSLPWWTPFLIVSSTVFATLYWLAKAASYRSRLIEARVAQFGQRVREMQLELQSRDEQLRQEEAARAELQLELEVSESDTSGRLAQVQEELRQRDTLIDELRKDRHAYDELLKEAEDHSKKFSREAEQVGKRLLGRFGDLARVEEWIEKLDSERANAAVVKRDDPKFARLQGHLGQWLRKSDGGPKETWSQHSHWTEVRDAYQRIDSASRNALFVLVRNGEYRDGRQRTISVVQLPGLPDQGELEIVLDDDAGRTLCLRFQLKDKKGVPTVERIGFALAVLIRAACKDFDAFRIR